MWENTIGNSGDFSSWQRCFQPPKCCLIFQYRMDTRAGVRGRVSCVHPSKLETGSETGWWLLSSPVRPQGGLRLLSFLDSRELELQCVRSAWFPEFFKWNHGLFDSTSTFAFLIPLNYKHLFSETCKDHCLPRITEGSELCRHHTRTQNCGAYETETWRSVLCDVLNGGGNCTAV